MHSLKLSTSLLSLLLLSTPIHATTARIWTHYFPACPDDTFSDLSAYESYEETATPENIRVGQCAPVNVPSYDHNLVSHMSIDAELISPESEMRFLLNKDKAERKCNITIHEVPGCIDTPLLSTKLRNGVAVSKCTMRQFAAYREVWAKLTCEQQHIDEFRTAQTTNLQTPGSSSESWRLAQTTQSSRLSEEQARVDNDGRAASERLLHDFLEYMMKKQNATKLTTGHYNATGHYNSTRYLNGTRLLLDTMSRRKLSVLRSRVRLH